MALRSPARIALSTPADPDAPVGRPDVDAAGRQEVLRLADRVLAEVEDRGGEHRVGARLETAGQVRELADATRRDHRDRDGGRDRADEVGVIAGAGAVAVHARDEQLAGAELRHAPAPG